MTLTAQELEWCREEARESREWYEAKKRTLERKIDETADQGSLCLLRMSLEDAENWIAYYKDLEERSRPAEAEIAQ